MTISREEHTVKRYDKELGQLRGLVLEMGGLAESQINRAIKALDSEDVTLAREVIALDHDVNALEVKADEHCVNIIALRQPMGSDLRLVMSLSKTVTDLERIGDEAEKIARMVIHLYDTNATPPNSRLFRDVFNMGKLAAAMLRDCLDTLARMDVDKALDITQADVSLDKELESALRHLITYMIEDPRTIGHALEVTAMLKALERVGDHCKNIAEYVIYYVKGKDIRHRGIAELTHEMAEPVQEVRE